MTRARTIVLHLTVSRDGFISLWDTPGHRYHGTNVELKLTVEQHNQIVQAMHDSDEDIGGDVKVNAGPYYTYTAKKTTPAKKKKRASCIE